MLAIPVVIVATFAASPPTVSKGAPVLVSTRGPAHQHAGELEAVGVTVVRTRGSAATVQATPEQMAELAARPWVRSTVQLSGSLPQSVESEALPLTGVRDQLLATVPVTGAGSVVAIVDTEFRDLALVTAAMELPTATALVCDMTGCVEGDVEATSAGSHGTLMAQLVHDVAPGAMLLLVRNNDGAAGLQAVVDELVALNVDVALLAHALPPLGPMDGRDPAGVHDALADAAAGGVLVVLPAGNGRRLVREQAFNSRFFSVNFFQEDHVAEDRQGFFLRAGERAEFHLTWNEWDATDVGTAVARDDLNIVVRAPNGTGGETVVPQAADPNNIQGGEMVGGNAVQDGDDFPYEHVTFVAARTGTHYLQVSAPGGVRPGRRFRLEAWGIPAFRFGGEVSSLAFPADSTTALAVGVASGRDARVQDLYSARGPTADGRIKPDLVGYDDTSTLVSTGVVRSARGSSVAAAHAAGLAAVMLAREPTLTREQLHAAMRDQAIHPGAAGAVDLSRGAGLLAMDRPGPFRVEILTPNPSVPGFVGLASAPTPFRAEVRVIAEPSGDLVLGLSRAHFAATVGANAGTIGSVAWIGNRYVLVVYPPVQATQDAFDLQISATAAGTTVSDTKANAVSYSEEVRRSQVVLVLDRSGSMAGVPMQKAKEAATLFLALLSPGDVVGIASFDDGYRLDLPLTPVSLAAAGAQYMQDFTAGVTEFALEGGWGLGPTSGRNAGPALDASPGGTPVASSNTAAMLATPLDTTSLGSPTLTYWTNFTGGADGSLAFVETSTDGVNWRTVRVYTEAVAQRVEAVPLPSSATAQFRFRLQASGAPSGRWVVDDVVVSSGPAQSTVDLAGAAIAAIQPGGATSIGGGMRAALDEIQRNGEPSLPTAVIVLSDGGENSAPFVASVLPDYVSRGVTAHTITLGGGDRGLMTDIARQSGGEHYFAADPEELADIYANLSNSLGLRGTLNNRRVSLQQTTPTEYAVPLDASIREAVFGVRFPSAEPVRVELRAPNGTTYTPDLPVAGASYLGSPGAARYQVASPSPGTWTLVMAWQVPISQPPRSLDVLVDVTITTDTRLDLYVTPAEPTRGDELLVEAVFASPLAPPQGMAMGLLRQGNTTWRFPMSDDGRGADRWPGDGVYAGRAWSLPVAGPLDVVVTVDVNAAGARRQVVHRVAVDPAPDADNDGMTDAWELRHGSNPAVVDGMLDFDGDGLNNAAEFTRGTHPLMGDTDGDGVADGLEVNGTPATDPGWIDTDEGGVSDGLELLLSKNPLVASDDQQGPRAALEADPGSVEFGDVPVNGTRTHRLVLTNVGATVLGLRPVMGGAGASAFTARTVAVESRTYPGRAAVLDVDFHPVTEGDFTASLALLSDDAGVRTVNVHGRTPVPDAGTVALDAGQDAGAPDAAQGMVDAGRPDAAVTPRPDAGTGTPDGGGGTGSSSGGGGSSSSGGGDGDGGGCGCAQSEGSRLCRVRRSCSGRWWHSAPGGAAARARGVEARARAS